MSVKRNTIFHKVTTTPDRILVQEQSSPNILPSYGTSHDPTTHYWYIKLPEEWQEARTIIFSTNVMSTQWFQEGKIW